MNKEREALSEILRKLERHEAARKATDERLKNPQSLDQYLDASNAADIVRIALKKWNIQLDD